VLEEVLGPVVRPPAGGGVGLARAGGGGILLRERGGAHLAGVLRQRPGTVLGGDPGHAEVGGRGPLLRAVAARTLVAGTVAPGARGRRPGGGLVPPGPAARDQPLDRLDRDRHPGGPVAGLVHDLVERLV